MVDVGGKATAVLEFRERPELYVCSSGEGLGELISGSKVVSKGRDFVLLMEYDPSLVKRMLPAFINARLRTADGISRSRSTQMEMLLLVCGTMNIGKALRERGVKDPKKFMVFATCHSVFRKFASGNDIRAIRKIALKLDEDAAGDVALTELSDK